MRRVVLFFLALACAWATPGLAFEGTLTPPTLHKGLFAYSIPDGWEPDGIGNAGLQHLQGIAQTLHFPFYVVLVKELPDLNSTQMSDSRSKGYRESGGELAASYAIDKLAEDWAAAYPDIYDVSKSTIFLLSYKPRQFRMLAGTDWKTKLGLEKDALNQFHQNFVRKVRGTPKDPRGGIADTMTAFDDYVFDQVDPIRVAAREEAARKAAEAKRLQAARASLDEEILILSEALDPKETPVEYLPADSSSYRSLLEKAKGVRAEDKPEAMGGMAVEMKPSVDLLRTHIDTKKSEATKAAFATAMKTIFLICVILALIVFIVRRFKTLGTLRTQFQDRYDGWKEKVSAAAGHYVAAYASRDGIVAMTDVKGRTKELWDATTSETDAIWIGVKALETHIEECLKLAAKGSLFRLSPLEDALSKLESPFDFDTGTLNKDELFSGETKTLNVEPQTFAESLTKRFKAHQKMWERLTEAANARVKVAKDAFPHTTMTALIDLTEKAGLPAEWYSDHPLAGDDQSDANVWKGADDLRWEDPVAYMERIEGFRTIENKVKARIDQILGALGKLAQAAKATVITGLNGTKLSTTDDPNVTLDAATHAYHEWMGLLTAKASTKDVETVLKASEEVLALYTKAQRQMVTAQSAITSACGAANTLTAEIAAVSKRRDSAITIVNKAIPVHAKAASLRDSAKAGDELLNRAQEQSDKVAQLLLDKNHLAAQRKAEQGMGSVKEANDVFKRIVEACDTLDREKAAFEAKVAKMGSLRSHAASTISQYGGSESLAPFTQPSLRGGVQDYAAMMSLLTSQERAWDAAARRAQEAYEEEQARIRREHARQEAERRRREQEEEDRRRRDSYSSYHSSSSSYSSSDSSSSWGSSSSGSSWGGGGSSSSGGGW